MRFVYSFQIILRDLFIYQQYSTQNQSRQNKIGTKYKKAAKNISFFKLYYIFLSLGRYHTEYFTVSHQYRTFIMRRKVKIKKGISNVFFKIHLPLKLLEYLLQSVDLNFKIEESNDGNLLILLRAPPSVDRSYRHVDAV